MENALLWDAANFYNHLSSAAPSPVPLNNGWEVCPFDRRSPKSQLLLIRPYIPVALEVVDGGAEVALLVDGEVDAEAGLFTVFAGRREADLVALVKRDDALCLLLVARQPVVIAVAASFPAEGQPADVADIADRQAEERLSRADSIVAGLESLRGGIGCAPADEKLVLRVLRLLV